MKLIKMIARAIGLKIIYNKLNDVLLKLRGYHFLGDRETITFLSAYEVKPIKGKSIALPQIPDCTNDKKIIFKAKKSVSDPVFVWEYKNETHPARLSKYGSVLINGKVLCMDWNHSSLYKDIWKKDNRNKIQVPEMIALFSQFQDGIFYGGYYDFIFLVATKIARIKDALPNLDLTNVPVSYPLFKTAYETEYLQMLGVNTANLFDSTLIELTSNNLITANSAHWYPNVEDVLSLKRHITDKIKLVKKKPERIYVSRKGRRCITNEAELIAMLKKFDFIIIEDKKRTVAEQIDLYYNASFIIGPHGASFSNIIWCEPGTHLLELFSPNYLPDFFLYLAQTMDMEYSAYYDGAANSNIDYLAGLVEDIHVSIPQLEDYLNQFFKSN